MPVTVKVAVYGKEDVPPGETTAVAVPLERTGTPTFAEALASTIGGLKVKVTFGNPDTNCRCKRIPLASLVFHVFPPLVEFCRTVVVTPPTSCVPETVTVEPVSYVHEIPGVRGK
jgi:hypothetical protein